MGYLDYKYCSSCGQRLIATSRFCNNCGARFQPDNAERVEVPAYQQPKYRDELEEYLWMYTNSERYIEKFRKKSKWNWSAFLFGPFWMGYRKMYAESAIYFGCILLINIIQILVSAPSIFYVVYFAVHVVIALYADKIYYRKAKKSIENILLLYGEREVRRSLIRKRGGTSGWGIAYAFIVLLISVFITLLIEIAVYPIASSTPAVSSGFTTTKSVTFAESVDKDSSELRAIRPGTVFEQGEVAIILDISNIESAVDIITTTIMKEKGGSAKIVDRFDSPMNSKVKYSVLMYSFKEKGHYRVTFQKPSGELIGDGLLDIE